MRNVIYALYRGDEFIDEGTADEIALRQGMSANTIRYYSYPAAHKRNKRNRGYKVIRLKEVYKYKREKCIICHKETKVHPSRLYHFEYGYFRNSQYNEVEHWNFCDRCFSAFQKWIKKYNGGKNEDI